MRAIFRAQHLTPPAPLPRSADSALREGMEQFCRRAAELMRAAALVDGTEPGLLLPADYETARRRGLAAAGRVLTDTARGKPQIAYYRSLTAEGLSPAPDAIEALADRVWVLEDRCGLADSYLRAVVDAALQRGAPCVICPSPLRNDRLEAVFLPAQRAAFLSMNAVGDVSGARARRVHLDRIPDAERRRALRQTLRENRRASDALLTRAAQNLASAGILRSLANDACEGAATRV